MKKILLILLAIEVLVISGCATVPPKPMVWVSTTQYTKEAIEKDLFDCKQSAAVASGVFSTAGSANTTATRRGNYEAIVSECMRSKGYVLEPKEWFEQKAREVAEISKRNKCKVGFFVSLADNVEAKIIGIVEDSPAGKAGLKVGDVIKKVNNSEVFSARQIWKVWNIKAGEPVIIVVNRSGFPKTFTLIPIATE